MCLFLSFVGDVHDAGRGVGRSTCLLDALQPALEVEVGALKAQVGCGMDDQYGYAMGMRYVVCGMR